MRRQMPHDANLRAARMPLERFAVLEPPDARVHATARLARRRRRALRRAR
jgi:hypothetical protein